MTNVTEMPTKLSIKDRVKNVLANRKVQIGLTIAITAVITALIARSEMFETKFTMDEVVDIINDVELSEAVTS